MVITASFIVICIVTVIGISLFGSAVCDRWDGDKMIFSVILLLICAAIFGVRNVAIESNIENNRRYDECIKEGHEVQVILEREVCVIRKKSDG